MIGTLDTPWRRPGARAYALARRRAALAPPVTVVAAPAGLAKEHDVPIAMRDGVTLRANVYKPEGEGPFPVLMSAHPYGKDRLPQRRRNGSWRLNPQFRVMNQPEPFTISSETGWEAPDPVFWVQQGYVVINVDSRGAGTSEGTGKLLSDEEAEDYYDLVEWAGQQPWSTGRVGLLGVSYLALSQYKVAALHPPSLAAICPWEGFTDAYADFMTPGDIEERGFSVIWETLSGRSARLSESIRKQRRLHPTRDAWWERLVPDLAAIEVPMLVCASFSDANLHSAGSFRAFERAGSRHKHAYTHRGPKWSTFYGDDAKAAQAAFFDRHLKGADAPALPAVRLEVRESRTSVAAVRDEAQWPPARATWTELQLDPVTFDLRRSAAAWEHTFEADTEVTGYLEAALAVSGAANLFLGAEKWSGGGPVPFEGSYGYGRDRVAIGWRRTGGGDVEVRLTPSATLFRAGESLRFHVAGRYLEPRNPLFGHFPARYRPSARGRVTVGGVLRLPVVRD